MRLSIGKKIAGGFAHGFGGLDDHQRGFVPKPRGTEYGRRVGHAHGGSITGDWKACPPR